MNFLGYFADLHITSKLLLAGAAILLSIIALRNHVFLWNNRKNKNLPTFASVAIIEKEDETEIHRSRLAEGGLVDRFPNRPDAQTLFDNFMETVKLHNARPFLGQRDDHSTEFRWESYGEILERATNIGSSLIHFGLQRGDLVGICARNRPEWIITEQACNAYSFVCVPLYDTFGDEAVDHIINQGSLKIIFADGVKITRLLTRAKNCKSVAAVVSYDKMELKLGDNKNVKILDFLEFENQGKNNRQEFNPPNSEDIATICYTSGTTGLPKGVMLTHGNLIADAAGCMASGIIELFADDVHLSYLPLAHMFERLISLLIISAGARVGFFRGDVKKHLFEDIQALKPTIFPSVPRLFSRIHDRVMQGINEYPTWKRKLFEAAFRAKKRRLLSDGIYSHYLWDSLVFRKIQLLLGGRVRVMITGSAPISPEVLDFMRICFACEVHEGYGQTECTAACCASVPGTFTTGNVGAPLPCAEIKLVDVPEMGYHSTDHPNPRGEICVRGPTVFKGYLNAPELTRETITKDGWLLSGDIGEWLPDGTLKVIDRKRNIFKVAQGEYIAPEKIENVLIRSKYVQMIFVHGISHRASIVAIVVPDPDAVHRWAKENHLENFTLETLCLSEDLKKEILVDINQVARENNLKGFEIPKAIYLEPKAFTPENNLVTPTLKLRRAVLKEHYQNVVLELYQSVVE